MSQSGQWMWTVSLPEESQRDASALLESEPLWLEQYAQLAQRMYEIRRRYPRLLVLGISTLQPRHSLPQDQLDLMVRLGLLNEDTSTRPVSNTDSLGWMALLKIWLWSLAYAASDTVMLVWLKLRWSPRVRRLQRTPATVVLKTWRFASVPLNGTPDFYYGDLLRRLRERGVSCIQLAGDGRGGRTRASFARAVLQEAAEGHFPEFLLVPLWAPMLAWFRQWRIARQLRREALAADHEDTAALYAAAARSCLEPGTMRNLLQFYIAREAVRRWHAKVYVTLYEGQPWEALSWHGAKAGDPQCVTAGYQHTVVMEHSLSIRMPNHDSWELVCPDIVLCLSEITRRLLDTDGQASAVAFGTFRRGAGFSEMVGPRPDRRTVLVLPEGIAYEERLLFNFAMQLAARLPDHQFIFRCHPAMLFDHIRPTLADKPARFPNIDVSKHEHLVDDVRRASVVLYRGSSSVLYAILHGLKPLYLHAARYPDVDPLFELDTWRDRTGSVEHAAHLLMAYGTMSSRDAEAHWQVASDYVQRYTQPVDDASVDRFLEAATLTQRA